MAIICADMKKTPPEIRILPENDANKIAAGEVVERPAAVVKELLENSIDAGATRIDVEFKHGGRTFMKVADDGCGMTREQALMSLEPHATSKIRAPEDIFKISSYGFRGEAVPSIASVSDFSLKTRPESSAFGTCVNVACGIVESVRECGMACGTEISVENLFRSVPARRKFLKSDNVEAAHIIKLCRLYALALPELAITLVENARVLFRSERNLPTLERIRRIFGAELADKLVVLPKVGNAAMSVEGAIARPAEAFATSRNICAFINGRPVESKVVFSAVKEAYSGLVPKGKFAAAFLFITLPPETVDVNVHPAKREVRLRNEFGVRDFLLSALVRRLGEFSPNFSRGESAAVAPDAEPEFKPAFTPASTGIAAPEAESENVCVLRDSRPKIESIAVKSAFRPSVADFADEAVSAGEVQAENPDASQPELEREDSAGASSAQSGAGEDGILHGIATRKQPRADFPPTDSVRLGVAGRENAPTPTARAVSEAQSAAVLDGWRYVGCLQKKFALFETKSGLELVNLTAALRRVRYARIMENLRGRPPESQLLLIPVNLRFDRADSETLDENAETFSLCGFKIEKFGTGFYRVSAAPAWLEFPQIGGFVRDFVETARDDSKMLRRRKMADEFFARAASRGATAQGFSCGETAAVSLLRELLSCESYMTDPDGKPTLREVSTADLSKMFALGR